jgi:hypothetical protein
MAIENAGWRTIRVIRRHAIGRIHNPLFRCQGVGVFTQAEAEQQHRDAKPQAPMSDHVENGSHRSSGRNVRKGWKADFYRHRPKKS